jgi:hypothetical protein
MIRIFQFGAASLFAALALAPVPMSVAQKSPKDLKPLKKTVWNLEGGAFFATDGRIPNGPCFRITGQVTAPEFFDRLKRIDDDNGTKYMRATEEVTEYPPRLEVSILLHDLPCSFLLKDKTFGLPLTKEEVGKLKLKLYWKHGLELKPTARLLDRRLYIRTLEPNIKPDANDLPERYEWNFAFELQSEGVPLEDSLVLTFEAADGTIAARTSARL